MSTTDPLGRVTQFTYDANGNVRTITDPLGNLRAFTYEPTFNKVTSITDPMGNLTTFEYDAQGNLTAITDPEQNKKPEPERLKTRIAYNASGQPQSTTDVLGNKTTFSYNAQGDLASITDPLGNATIRTYDTASRLLSQTDPRGKATRFAYDNLNRLTDILDALGSRTGFTYDPNGNLRTVTDARGNSITHEYDSMDRLSQRIDQLGAAETFRYDGNGNLVSTTDRKGQTTIFAYDPLNRRVRSEFADGTVATFTYDAASRLIQANDTADPHRPIGMQYDSLDRLLAETTSLGTVSYQYDALGRRRQMTVGGQAPVDYTYDGNSRLRTITQAPLNPVTIDYDAAGRRTLLTLPNGVSTEYVYDLGSRLTALAYRNALGLLGNLTYRHDATGNRIGMGGSFARTLLPDLVPSATYDVANRLLTFGAKSMAYDSNGNLAATTEGANSTTYTWTVRDSLDSLSGPQISASFSYDAAGRRAQKTINGRTTSLQYDGVDIGRELSGPDVVNYLRGLGIDEPLVRVDSAMTSQLLPDGLGSSIMLIGEAGQVTTTYTYGPFGLTSIGGLSSTNPLQYTGRENDSTGLYYYRARYYSPAHHRFISEDPLRLLSRDVNLYAYVGNNPITFLDPLGLDRNFNPCRLIGHYPVDPEACIGRQSLQSPSIFLDPLTYLPVGGVASRVVSRGARAAAGAAGPASNWNFWSGLPKVSQGGTSYAKIGDWIFTKHAIDNMVPRGLGGRGVPVGVVQDVLANGKVSLGAIVKEVQRLERTLNNVTVITEGKIVVTVIVH